MGQNAINTLTMTALRNDAHFQNKLNIIIKRFKALIPKNKDGGDEHGHHNGGGGESAGETEE